ncbi:acyltransferase family protein [Curtobacterium luteum]|uniref:Acyltransferase n=1 Tax=Curtobacterium luteum TaxID=33881 RepID=A0A175S4A8_9MICO|nr:acyltransferase family protein [Curtobacterium luteum]KTR11740.1 hypothetical protein NS184_00755 [Curtobacterium luteum]
MSSSFRPELEGLRALAVALVVAQHAFSVPRGGWIGVDVFFVLSGYLITRGLVGEIRAGGRIDYAAFIIRRARRILPAAVFVVLVTVAAGWALWFRPRAVALTLDAVASLLSVENVHLIVTGTSYFAEGGPVSPLQHYWSLAVEEQFYAVWPLLVIATAAVWGKRVAARRLVARIALAAVVASVAWAVVRGDGTGVYFDPVVRTWELAAGALVAALAVSPRPRMAGAAVVAGLGLVLSSAVLVPASVTNPLPAVVPPVIGTALVIVGGDRAPVGVTAALRWRPVRFVGRISFSLYLWHFPVLVFLRSVFPEQEWTPVVAVLLAVALAAFSYRWVERPFAGRPLPVRRRRARRPARTRRLVAVGATAPLLVAATIAQVALPAATRPEAAAARLGLAGEARSATSATAQELRAALLHDPVRDDVSSVLDSAFTTEFAPEMSSVSGCRNELTSPVDRARTCTTPGSGRRALVIGDSIAMSWVPAVRRALADRGWEVRALGFASCAPADAGRTPTLTGDGLCEHARTRMRAEVGRVRPDLLIVANDEQAFSRTLDADGDQAGERWEASTRRLLDDVRGAAGRTVLLGAPPIGADPAACATRRNGVDHCTTTPSAAGRMLVAANEAAVAGRSDAAVIDVVDWFCADDRCPVVAGDLLVRVDERHLTNAYSERLGGVLRGALFRGADAA